MTRATLIVLAVAFVALLYLGIKWWGGPIIPEPDEATRQYAQGFALFSQNCAECHGTEAEGALGPALNLANEDQLRTALMAGFYPMPDFSGAFSDEEITALWAYINAPRED